MASTYLTTAETATVLRLAVRTLERMRIEGRGPRFRRHGRRVLYSTVDLDAWSEARAHLSTSDVHAEAA